MREHMAMEENEESKTYQYMLLLLGLASIVLATTAIYIVEILSINYGVGFGAMYQSNANHMNVTNNLTFITSQLNTLHSAISETYIIAFISFAMMGAATVLYMTRYRRFGAMSRRYTLLHTVLTLIYAAMFFIVVSTFPINYTGAYFLLLYFTIAVALAIDLYLEFVAHSQVRSAGLGRSGMRIEPGTPYTNLLNLRDRIFSKLNGDVRIVDKHFNSDAISNLHRLLETNLTNIKRLEVLTSKEMFDSKFNDNYTDFKNELANAGVQLDFMLMSDQDSVAQHERFIFDEEKAFKIPPLNIINKKSEHIVSLRVGEAKSRFDNLMKNATKYDNYVVKQARDQ
jgi:hypothetical protein